MSKFDREGNLWVLLTLTGSFTSDSQFRGWCLRITPEGKAIPTCSGVRSPGGIGDEREGGNVLQRKPGTVERRGRAAPPGAGNISGTSDRQQVVLARSQHGNAAARPDRRKSRIYIEAAENFRVSPARRFSSRTRKLGQSQSGIICDMSGGKFGPFEHQMFCSRSASQQHRPIRSAGREGTLPGRCFPFREGFASGIVPMIQAPDGSFFVGGTNRGWGSVGPKPFALERLVWTGKVPFEMYNVKLAHDGFDITFTEPVDKAAAGTVASYKMNTFRYIYRSEYGSPEVDPTTPTIKSATVSDDGKGASGSRRPADRRNSRTAHRRRPFSGRSAAAA